MSDRDTKRERERVREFLVRRTTGWLAVAHTSSKRVVRGAGGGEGGRVLSGSTGKRGVGVPTRRGMQIRNAWAESGEGRRASEGGRMRRE